MLYEAFDDAKKMKFLNELSIDLQVFAQELLREHLVMKFS